MIERLVTDNLDQVVGVRRGSAYRTGHQLGNQVLNRIVCAIFGDTMGDMLSGYRVFSRRFVKSFPAVSREFEIETELTVHALALRIPSATVDVDFTDRRGLESKLRTYRDGWKILNVILTLTRHERPIHFFGWFSILLAFVATGLATPVLVTYLHTGMVPRLPTLFVASFLGLMACVLFVAGIVIDGTRKARHETSRLAYMRHPPCAHPVHDPLTTRTSPSTETGGTPRRRSPQCRRPRWVIADPALGPRPVLEASIAECSGVVVPVSIWILRGLAFSATGTTRRSTPSV